MNLTAAEYRDTVARPGTAPLELSFPPSVNNLFPTMGKKRVPSREYTQWRSLNGWNLKQLKPPKFAGQVNVWIDLIAPDRRRRDAGNYEKAITDLLVEHGIIAGDDSRFVKRVSTGWVDGNSPGAVVTITSVEALQNMGENND